MNDHTTDSRRGGKAPYLLISLAVLVLDQWTKWLVELHLPHHASVEVIPNLLSFTHVRNTGVAFGLFAAHGDATGTLVLSLLGLLALTFVGFYFHQVPRDEGTLLVALALVLGGAVGNLIDRLATGSVTDFVDFYVGSYHWHTFNVADSAITVGIGLMLASSLRRPRSPEAATGAQAS
ncbi:MAG: signal peptidase II [Acidobacteria bacterium]|nr:MAG: signal peptidase II [Acidobacteriota bacterium]